MKVVRFEFSATSGLTAVDATIDEANLVGGIGYAERTTSTGHCDSILAGG